MNVALDSGGRGPALLLRHCLAVGALAAEREPAARRLERALGHELAARLRRALAPQGRRGSSSP